MISAFLLLVNNNIEAQDESTGNVADSIEISLLTCSPHDEVYSLYGHTAIRFQDKSNGTDLAINYGVFSFDKPYFVLRFVFGLTDYEMGIVTFKDFCQEYAYYGATVTQQTLNLSDREKLRIVDALQKNYMPENRVYRYNYFYNNCTTKARDILLSNINGKVVFNNRIDGNVSFRDMIHSCNEDSRWARFGNDMLLGMKADFSTTREEQQFLPANLMRDFEKAVVISADGRKYPLVKRTETVVGTTAGNITATSHYPTPSECAWAIFGVIALLSAVGMLTRKKLIFVDVLLLLSCGLSGIMLFVMLFSQHPTTSTNLQIIILNPAALFFTYYIIKNRRNNKRLARLWIVLTAVLAVFLLGGIFQSYAEGLNILASSLLVRTVSNIIIAKRNEE